MFQNKDAKTLKTKIPIMGICLDKGNIYIYTCIFMSIYLYLHVSDMKPLPENFGQFHEVNGRSDQEKQVNSCL